MPDAPFGSAKDVLKEQREGGEMRQRILGPQRVVVLGGRGSVFGLTVLQQLSALADNEDANVVVTLVQESKDLVVPGELLNVLDGSKSVAQVVHPVGLTGMSPEIRWVCQGVESLNVKANVLTLMDETRMHFDLLIVASNGMYMDWDATVPGALETLLNVAEPDDVALLRRRVHQARGGETFLFCSCSTESEFVDPVIPFEYAFTIHELLVRRGVRETCRIVVTTPWPEVPFGNQATKAAFLRACKEKGIELKVGFTPLRVHRENRLVDFAASHPDGADAESASETIAYDVLFGTHSLRLDPVFRALHRQEGAISSDKETLCTATPGVLAAGHASRMTTPLAMHAARNAGTVVEALATHMTLSDAKSLIVSIPETHLESISPDNRYARSCAARALGALFPSSARQDEPDPKILSQQE